MNNSHCSTKDLYLGWVVILATEDILDILEFEGRQDSDSYVMTVVDLLKATAERVTLGLLKAWLQFDSEQQ